MVLLRVWCGKTRTVTTPNVSERFIVDSSGWVEYLAGGPKADAFAPYLESASSFFFLPSIIVYEVYKKLLREQGKHTAETFLSQAFGFGNRLVPLDLDLAILASRLSIQTRLSMADSIIYATADRCKAQLITTDSHFQNLSGVTIL